MWLLNVPRCRNCSAVLSPNGVCGKCGRRGAPHGMSWGQYYKEVERDERLATKATVERLLPILAVGLVLMLLAWLMFG